MKKDKVLLIYRSGNWIIIYTTAYRSRFLIQDALDGHLEGILHSIKNRKGREK